MAEVLGFAYSVISIGEIFKGDSLNTTFTPVELEFNRALSKFDVIKFVF